MQKTKRFLSQIIFLLVGLYAGFSALSTFVAAFAVFRGASSDTESWFLALLGLPSLILSLCCFLGFSIISKNLKFGRTKAEWALERVTLLEKWRIVPSKEVMNKVKDIVADVTDIKREQISEDFNFFRDSIDSFHLMELLMVCEETFGVEMPDEEIAVSQITTVSELTDYILQKLTAQ